MDLKEIITVSGKKSLYKLVNKGRNNMIVESLSDGSRMPVFATTPAGTLADIRIFTETAEMPLKDVFKRIYDTENGNKAIDAAKAKSTEIETYMAMVLPEYDSDRVHISDMKKLFSWYNQLLELNLLSFDEEKAEKEEKEEDKKE